MDTLIFKDIPLHPIQDHQGQIWITSTELARLLAYKQENSVSKIYNRNSDEFTENMTQVIDNTRIPNMGIRVFSLRGCHLVAMFSRTAVAKEFRRWVLDVLDRRVQYELTIEREQNYVKKSAHESMALRYHSMFREYEDNIASLNQQIGDMQLKCRKLDLIIEDSAMTLDQVAQSMDIQAIEVENALNNLGWLIKCRASVKSAPIYFAIGEQAKAMDWLLIDGTVENGVVKEVIKITADGLNALQGRLQHHPQLLIRR